ncbi:MAG: FAD-binding oxidoreductase, partial [Actinomyces sp.]|nr:FAD-binding oxidoreductase [Actinomyces sp.]
EALDLCLACKACSADCPAGVDMARYRSEALFRTYRGRPRPLSHYTLGWLPRLTRVTARVPGLARIVNVGMSVAPLRSLAFRVIGLDPRRGMPALQSGTFNAWARRRSLLATSVPSRSDPGASARERGNTPAWSDSALEREAATASSLPDSPILSGPRDPGGRPYALVWADSFSQTLDDAGARAVVDVLEANGFAPIIAPDACCGLTWITTGQLTGAKKHLTSLLSVLAPFAASGIPIVGVEPSCTAVLRDDLLDLLPEDPRSALVSGATRTLAEALSVVPASARRLPSLEGVEIVAQPHCHHYSVMGWDTDQALLESLGARVTRLEGCCGLAGNFGMEAGHYDLSVAVASHSLLPTLDAQPDAVYLADGFSCRTQAAQLAGRGGVHLATLLAGK